MLYWFHKWNEQYTNRSRWRHWCSYAMYNFKKYSDNYSKTSKSLWQYYRDELALTDADVIAKFSDADNNALFKFNRWNSFQWYKNVEIMIPFIYLSTFWRTLEKPLNNCEIIFILIWPEKGVLLMIKKQKHFQ